MHTESQGFEGERSEEDKAGSHCGIRPEQLVQATGSVVWGRWWLIALSRNFRCIVTGRGGLQCPCSTTIITMYCRGYVSVAKACIFKRVCAHGDGTDRHILVFVKWAEASETMEPRSLLRRCMRGRWTPGILLSWGGGGGGVLPSFSFFPCMRARKGAGREVVALLPCWVPGSLLQYRTQYSDHLASQGALWSLQWCQSEKRATPSRLARRWLPARSECWSAVSSSDRNPLWAGRWAGGLLFVLICLYMRISLYV